MKDTMASHDRLRPFGGKRTRITKRSRIANAIKGKFPIFLFGCVELAKAVTLAALLVIILIFGLAAS